MRTNRVHLFQDILPNCNVEMQDGAREFRKPRHSSHTQAKANHDLQAADFAKHSSLLINNVKGKKREEDY